MTEEQIKAFLFTTWYRPGNDKVYIITDTRAEFVGNTAAPNEPNNQYWHITHLVLTSIGSAHRQSILVSLEDFVRGDNNGLLKQVVCDGTFKTLSKSINTLK